MVVRGLRWSARGAEAFAVLGLPGDKALTILAIIFWKSKEKAAGLQIKSIQSSLELYYIDTGNYPSEAAGLAALVTPPSGVRGWAGPYIDSPQALDDPWAGHISTKAPARYVLTRYRPLAGMAGKAERARTVM